MRGATSLPAYFFISKTFYVDKNNKAGFLQDAQGNKSNARLNLSAGTLFTMIMIAYVVYQSCQGRKISIDQSVIELVTILLAVFVCHANISKFLDFRFGGLTNSKTPDSTPSQQ